MHFQPPHPQNKLVPSSSSEPMAITRNRSPTGGSRGRRAVDFGSLFKVGTKVEVSSNEDGFRGAWYSASIVGPPRRSPRGSGGGGGGGGGGSGVLVEYETLLSEANSSEFLIEFIALPFVRPLPPEEKVKAESFQVLDVVDALHRDGWWKGVVTEVVERNNGGKGEQLYNVVFDDPCHEIVFRASKLRLHLEWVNGSWTNPCKQKRIKGLTFSTGMEVEVNLEKNSSKEAWYPATIVDEVGFCSFLVTCKSMESHVVSSPGKITVDCFNIRPLPPKVDIKSFRLLESVYAFYDSAWRPGYIIEVVSRKEFVVCMQNDMVEKEFSLLEIRPYLYWKDGKWHAGRDSHGEVNSELVDKNAITYFGTNPGNGTTEKHRPKLLNSCSKSERKGVKRSSPGSGAELLCAPRKSKRRNSNDSSFSPQRAADLQLADASTKRNVSTVAEIDLQKGIDRNGKNKGKDKRVPEAGITDIDEDIHTCKISELALVARSPAGVTAGITNDIENLDPAIKEVDMQMIAYVDHSVLELCAADLINQDSAVEEVEPLLLTYLQDGASDVDERISAFQEGDLPMLPCAEPVDEECNEPEVAAGEMNDEVDMVQDIELPTITSEKPADECNEPEVAAGEMNAEVAAGDIELPTITSEKPAGESLCDGEKLCEQPSEEERGGPALAPADGIPSELVENAEISFDKTTAVWKTIESLEPFQLLPQNPHFRPLVKCPELNREANAISAMFLFSKLVERTSKLQYDDPIDLFESCLKSLSDLDAYGFDVKPVVERIETLLEIKKSREEIQDTSEQLQHKIADNKAKKSNLAEGIEAADKKIKELQEKRASDAAMLSAVEAELATFRSDASVLEEKDAMAKQKFRSIVGSHW